MKLLIIGGTVFVGRAFVEAALAQGHEVTLFNRGQHNAALFPDVEKLRGNRDGDLEALRGRQWDAVLDTCGYFPRVVRQSAQLLTNAVGHYTFISSISVFDEFTQVWDENGPLAHMDAADAEAADKVTGENYGALKVRCEQVVEEAFPDRALIIRPGLIVGPHDPTDRFTYWPARIARGGDVLVPGQPEQHVELIDVRDLAEWNLRLVEQNTAGIYNATGPATTLTQREMMETGKTVTGSDARFVYVPGSFLTERDVDPNQVNFWCLPDDGPNYRHFNDVDCRKAQADGLTFRPLAETMRDTLAWDSTRPADREWRAGLTPEKETELLNQWQQAQSPA